MVTQPSTPHHEDGTIYLFSPPFPPNITSHYDFLWSPSSLICHLGALAPIHAILLATDLARSFEPPNPIMDCQKKTLSIVLLLEECIFYKCKTKAL